jgi:hypothetical protein
MELVFINFKIYVKFSLVSCWLELKRDRMPQKGDVVLFLWSADLEPSFDLYAEFARRFVTSASLTKADR